MPTPTRKTPTDGTPSDHDLRPSQPAPRKTDIRQGLDTAGALVRLTSDAALERHVAARRNVPEACGVDKILLAEEE